MAVENPGSLLTFAERSGVSPDQAQFYYADALDKYRQSIARELGITLEELHEIPRPIRAGSLEKDEK